MANTLRIKRRISGNAGAPTTLANAEIAYNEVDNILYYGKGDDGGGNATSVIAIAGDGRYAPLASPALTGSPTAPTATQGDNDTSIATTAFVNAEIAADAAPIGHVGATGTAHGNATTSVAGFMSGADKTKLDGVASGATANTGTVTSVGLSLPAEFTVSNSPVTTSGTLTATKASQTANQVYAAPNGSAGAPTFRALVAADVPTLNQNTTGTAANVTGTVAVANGGTGATTQQAALNALAGGTTSAQYLRGTGTNITLSAIQAGDVPTLNQNTTGNAANVTGTVAIANGGTGATVAATALSNLGGAPLASPSFTGTPVAPTATAGTNNTQLATTAFVATAVDAARSGLDVKASVRVATTAAGTLSTSFANGQVVDSVTLATGNRILIKDQAAGAENGIYTVNVSGAPTRATDADANEEVTPGLFTFVEEGTVNADSGWVLSNNGTITLGTTALTFAQFSGAGAVEAGAGLTKTGATLDIGTASTARILVNADNIDLATVTQSDTSGTAGINFVQSIAKDTYGRVTGRVVADVRAGTTAQTGILQLSDATNSTSTTLAATANAVKTAYDLATGRQPGDATLTALAGVTTAADQVIYATGADAFSVTSLTSFARTLLDDTSAALMQATLGIGNMTLDGGTF